MTAKSMPHTETVKELAEWLGEEALSSLADRDEGPLVFAIEVVGYLAPYGTSVVVMLSALRLADAVKIDLARHNIRSKKSFERKFGFSFRVTMSQPMMALLVLFETGLIDLSSQRAATLGAGR